MTREKITHASLFSGIGACELAAKRNDIENIFHCEINDFCRKFLDLTYKGDSYADITTTDFRPYAGRIDILTGGFPCQDASRAKQHGNGQKGLDGERTGLWKHMVRAIYECRPKFIIAENVSDILKVNNGRDFGIILASLSRMGYNAEWRVCNGYEVGLCNERKRLWLVAYSNSIGLQQSELKSLFEYVQQERVCKRLRVPAGATLPDWSSWGGKLQVSAINHGLPEQLFRDNGKTKVVREFFKCSGNSMHPQIPELIMKRIKEIIIK